MKWVTEKEGEGVISISMVTSFGGEDDGDAIAVLIQLATFFPDNWSCSERG